MGEPVACVVCGGLYVPHVGQRWCSLVCREVSKARAEGAAAERTAIAHTLKARAKTLRDRKALGAAEEVEALAFYVEQRGVAAEARPAGEVAERVVSEQD